MATTVYKLGRTRVDLLRDGVFEASRDSLNHPAGPETRDRILAAWGTEPLRVVFAAFLLRDPNGTALFETGAGSG